MDCPKTESVEDAVACPPDDSLVDIFSRLHAKPLFRFKCVSKAWCDLIADRLRCRKFPQTLEGFFAAGAVENYGRFIDLSGRPVPLVDPSFSFLTKLPEIKKIHLLDSCNGLVLFGRSKVSHRYPSLGYIVCNPATEFWVPVPSPFPWLVDIDRDDEDHDLIMKIYLVFDPAISPHFRLILFMFGAPHDLQKVYSFSSVNGAWTSHIFSETWRHEFEEALDPTMVMVDIVGVCPFNGMLHLHVGVQHLHYPFEDQNMILAFGGEGRLFKTLHWPQNDRDVPVFVGQSQGHLHCVFAPRFQGHLHCLNGCETELSILVLEDYHAEKWVLRDNVSFSQLFRRMSGRCHESWKWKVVGIHPDRSLVFFAYYWNYKLISYDMDKKEVLTLFCLHGYRGGFIPYVPYFAE